MSNLLQEVKKSAQDFEWYPTTNEIIKVLQEDVISSRCGFESILDIGAGNGKVLSAFNNKDDRDERGYKKWNFTRYAIEKSEPLLNVLDKDIIILGTDFMQTTLIDKEVDIVFCNPPYSDYAFWASKIIKEANATNIYLVIPERWKNNQEIKNALNDRDAEVVSLGNFDFENAEDRKARAKVELIKIEIENAKSSFSLWFDNEFGELPDENKFIPQYKKNEEKQEEISQEISTSTKPLINILIDKYNLDTNTLFKQYKSITSLDADILQSFNISKSSLLKGFEKKIKGLKNLYWKMLFDRLEVVNKRLTTISEEKMLEDIFSNTAVDFNHPNIKAIVNWFLKNANYMLEEQVVEFYERMLTNVNCEAYKSNEKVFKQENWGFTDKPKHLKVKMSNRIIVSHGTDGWNHRMNFRSVNYLNDILVIARELGYSTTGYWESDQETMQISRNRSVSAIAGIKYKTHYLIEYKELELVEFKVFKNGNTHIKFNQRFITKINVIYGRMKGWITSKEEAESEIGKGASDYFDYNLPKISNLPMLDFKN